MKHHLSAKALMDTFLGIILWLMASPLMFILIVAVRVGIGSPVFFRQWRPGHKGSPFEIVKFRTMADLRDADGELLPDAQRMTKFGQILRSCSLDELPELYNVLKGEMSLVGPRPLLMEYLGHYSAEQFIRHDVKPGITGWAQVNGRNDISWDEKFYLDLWYVKHQNFWLDIEIIGKTIRQVIKRSGISKTGHATTDKFTSLA
jgi:lipopolysaccharide/colanic/teichoic acid biosynthesis glycosyltransferase